MTKDVCYKALNQLQAYASQNGGKFEQEHEILSKLIKQHFDNPPLSFDELEAGMWVWDNKYYDYIKIEFILEDKKLLCCDGFHRVFEENRFYRKQVEE